MKLRLNKLGPVWKRLGYGLLFFLILVIGNSGGWWDFFTVPATERPVSSPGQPAADIIIKGPFVTGWNNLAPAWTVQADTIRQTGDGSVTYIDRILHGVINSIQEKKVEFSAGWARWEQYRSDLFLGGNIMVKIDEGVLTTPSGILNTRSQELACREGVIYREGETDIKADRLRFNFEKEELVLEGNVDLKQKRDQIKCGGLIYSLKDKKYYLQEPGEIIIYP